MQITKTIIKKSISWLRRLLGINQLSEQIYNLSNNLSSIEESVNLLLQRENLDNKKPIRAVFLVHNSSSWIATLPVVKLMIQDERFEPLVFSLPHKGNLVDSHPLIGEETVHHMLDRQGIPHFRIFPENINEALTLIKTANPCLIFRQDPWEVNLPKSLSASSLAFARLCYIPYGYMIAAIQKLQFDQDFHRKCWRIFCPNELYREMSKKYNLLGDSMCVVTGYPKFDEILSCDKPVWPLASMTRASAHRIIWAPHHSFQGDWLRFGDFEKIAPLMLSFAKTHSNVQIVLRPHPALTDYVDTLASHSPVRVLMSEWNKLPNTAYSRDPDYAGLFYASDLLVTDGLGFLTEYQLLDKPLVFIERSDSIGFNEAGQKYLTGLYRVTDYTRLESLILDLLNGWEDQKIVAARKTNLADLRPFPEKAAENILGAILVGLTK